MSRPTAIDLFAGAGGLSLGIEQAGFDIISAVEIDPVHACVHKFNFPNTKVFCNNIEELSGYDLMLGRESIDLIIGGPPCQGFSMIGKRDMSDQRNSLVMQYMRIVSEVKPRYFIMENVGGITIGKAKDILDEAIGFIETFGYHVVKPYKVLNAVDFGVPQARKRLFLLGYRDGEQEPTYPQITTQRTTVRDAIEDLPNIDDFPELLDKDTITCKVHPNSTYACKLHDVSLDITDFSYRRVWDPEILTGELRTIHTETSKERFAETTPGETEPVSRFFKLSWEGVCNTLRAGTDKSRGAYTSPRPIHPVHARCISVREAQRLHSFPDWFRVHSTKWHGFREVGNSVPPLLARYIGLAIAKAMDYSPCVPEKQIHLGDIRYLYANATEAQKLLEE